MNRTVFQRSLMRSALLGSISAVLASQAYASNPAVGSAAGAKSGPTVVGDFGLIDHQGNQQQMTRLGNNKAVVIISQANSCQENINQLPKYKLMRTLWEKKGVKFLMLNASKDDNLEAVRRAASVYDIDFPIMIDESQLVAESLNISKAGEVLVLNPQSMRQRRLCLRLPREGATRERHTRLCDRCRADPEREMRAVSRAGRHRAVRHEQLRHRARLFSDDSRGLAHQAHAAGTSRSACQ
jgi:AhpC/TSA family